MSANKVDPHRSSLGMDANIAALLVYLAAGAILWIPFLGYIAFGAPLVFFFLEKESKFVKFHAMQAAVIAVFGCALKLILDIVWSASVWSVSGWGLLSIISTINLIIQILICVAQVFCLYKAYTYDLFKLPLVGNWAEKLCIKFDKSA